MEKPQWIRRSTLILYHRKLSLQGHSIFFASSDYGVGGAPFSADINNCLSGSGQDNTIYNPDSPSSCPYVTSVGQTRLYPGQTIYDRESAGSANFTALTLEGGGPDFQTLQFFGSGGGFSNYFSRPDYQDAAVSTYLSQYNSNPSYVANDNAKNLGANGGVFNRAGRGYPDVSANGHSLLVYVNESLVTIYGTSLASPIFASIITLINEERTAAGKGPVGFINPVLYQRTSKLLSSLISPPSL